MQLRAFRNCIVAIAAMAAVAPAGAQQLYKWVDDRGVTNYSNQPPADPKSAKNLRPVEDKLSVYSPDPSLVQAIEDSHKNFDQRQTRRRIEELEDQVAAERSARQQAAAAAQNGQRTYDACIAAGRLDCGEIYGIYPYPAPVVVVPRRHRHQPIPQAVLTPGTTAGNVTAGNNFIPGNSAAATNAARPPREAIQRRSADGRGSRPASERPLLERR